MVHAFIALHFVFPDTETVLHVAGATSWRLEGSYDHAGSFLIGQLPHLASSEITRMCRILFVKCHRFQATFVELSY